MTPHRSSVASTPYPSRSWYPVASGDQVSAGPLARRALDIPLVLFRTSDGTPVALEDRDAHRPYPLSLGHVVDDLIVSSYSGFAYDHTGRCVRVPTQDDVPYGARVRAFPVTEQDGLVWAWFAEPGLAALHPAPRAPWLTDPGWATFGAEWTTEAGYRLLHENFADITHVAVVDPTIAPPVLTAGPVPQLDVEVSETSVSFERSYPPAPLAPWHSPLVGVDADTCLPQREHGRFVGPGMWVDSWDVTGDEHTWTFRFTHAVTPVDPTTTRHAWFVSRNFALGDDVSENLHPLFAGYYDRVRTILQTMQQVIVRDGARQDVNVAADAAAIQVRKILDRMLADERAS